MAASNPKKKQNKSSSPQQKPKTDDNNDKEKPVVNYMKYTGMAFQMGIIILIGTFIGQWLDTYFELERPYLTVVCALFSIFAALYIVLKDLFRS